MIHLKPFGLTESQINEGFGPDETAVIKELKADLDRLVKQKLQLQILEPMRIRRWIKT